jgi:hypothetical protein
MPLYTRSGGLLTRSGSLADNAACCCGPIVSSCCSGASRQVPASISISLSLGTKTAGFFPTSCARSLADGIINGTYVCPYRPASSGPGFAVYQDTFASGMLVGADWWCSSNSVLGNQYRLNVAVSYCDLSASCYKKTNWGFYFNDGSNWGGATSPSLCSITIGDTTAITSSTSATGQTDLQFYAGVSSCSGGGTSWDFFGVDVSVTPSW